MGQPSGPQIDAADDVRRSILDAMKAANRLKFPECFAFLNHARARVAGLREAERTLPSSPPPTDAIERAVDFFHTSYEAMRHRVERNPGKALKTYEQARTMSAALVNDQSLAAPIRRLIEAEHMIIPVQSQLCSAVECLFVGDFDRARQQIQLAESKLAVALDEIGIDINRVDVKSLQDLWTHVLLQAMLPRLSQEKIVGALGVCADFVVSSSIIKLQYCLLTQKYQEEIGQFQWIKNVFGIFQLYTTWTSIMLSDESIKYLSLMMTICSSFAAASGALVEAGFAAQQGNFAAAYDGAALAKRHLNETSKTIERSEIRHAHIFQEAIVNVQLFAIPQMESRWQHDERHRREIANLQAQLDKSNSERMETLKIMSAGFGVTFNNTNELRNAVRTNVEVNMTYDRALDELESILDEIRKIAPAGDSTKIENTMREIGDAKQTRGLAQKLEKLKSIFSNMSSIVDSFANSVPKIATAFSTLAKLFGL